MLIIRFQVQPTIVIMKYLDRTSVRTVLYIIIATAIGFLINYPQWIAAVILSVLYLWVLYGLVKLFIEIFDS